MDYDAARPKCWHNSSQKRTEDLRENLKSWYPRPSLCVLNYAILEYKNLYLCTGSWCRLSFYFFFFYSSNFLSSHVVFYISFQLVTQIRGRTAGSATPFPLRYVASFWSREDFRLFFPRRLASNCAYPRCKALPTVESILFLFLQLKSNVRPTWASNPGLKTQEEFEVNHLNDRGDRVVLMVFTNTFETHAPGFGRLFVECTSMEQNHPYTSKMCRIRIVCDRVDYDGDMIGSSYIWWRVRKQYK